MKGPSTSLSFLSITIDAIYMQLHLPQDKLQRIRDLITEKSATKREILSLVGLLQHATEVVHCGRLFVSRMFATAAKVKHLEFYARINS